MTAATGKGRMAGGRIPESEAALRCVLKGQLVLKDRKITVTRCHDDQY